MAVPKDKLSAAFQQKCLAAGDKLRKFQSDKLKSDIERLYNENIQADFTLDLAGQTLSLHKLIIKARSVDLYEKLLSLSKDGSSGDSAGFRLPADIQQSLKLLYTVDDVAPILEALSRILTDSYSRTDLLSAESMSCGEGGNDSTECENGHCKPRADNKDTVNGDPDSLIVTGAFATDALTQCAQGIVAQVLESAKAIIEAELSSGDTEAGHDSNKHSDNGDREVDEFSIDEQSENRNGECDSEVNLTADDKEEMVNGSGQAGNSLLTMDGASTGTGTDRDDLNVYGKCSDGTVLKATSHSRTGCIQGLICSVYKFDMKMQPCCELGEDLLWMLLEQRDCDCVIKVDGDSFLAHRCVLIARSWYFEAMLSGSWRESEQEEIVLEGIDSVTVRQMLLYLYGGVIEVGSSCGLGSLIMVADMYTMAGLKDIVAFNLNMEHCHFFHRPCPGCTAGVPEALALTMMYNLDSLKDKCVKWINKNFGKVWPTKTFALLPQEVLEFCTSTAVKDLALNNVVETMVECRKLNEKTPHLKWTEPVFDMITQLMDAAIEFASQNFVSLVVSNAFKKIDSQGIAFNLQLLEEIFVMVIQALTPENSCKAYLALNKWMVQFKPPEDQPDWKPMYAQEFCDFVGYLFNKCKEQLCLYIHQAANTEEWGLLTMDMQREIMEEANYVCIESKARMARPKLTSMQKKITATTPLTLKEYFECHFGSKDGPAAKAVQKDHAKTSKGTNVTAKNAAKKRPEKQELPKGKMATRAKEGTKSSSKSQHGQSDKAQSAKAKTFATSAIKKSAESVSSQKIVKGENLANASKGSNKINRIIEDDDSMFVEASGPRQRCNSAGASVFKPHFGVPAPLTSSRSMDSFLEARPGHTSVVQPLIPTLEVNFIVPHEFHETF